MKFTLAELLGTCRKRANLAQDDAAEIADVSRQTISNWETGKRSPPVEKAIALLDRYGVPNDERRGLMDGTP